MEANKYYTIAKIVLLIPLVTGLLTVVDLILPLQKVTTTVEHKKISERQRFGTTTYSIDFANNNDQFTEEIYNAVTVGDPVVLETLYLSKEVKTLRPQNSTVILENNTSEIYFQMGMALAFIGFGSFFLRKAYYTKKNYRYIIIVSIISFFSLIRIITLNC